MFITILLLLIACFVFLCLFSFQLYKKNDLQLGNPIFIFIVISFFSVFLLSVYFLLDISDTKFEDYRYFFIGITSILALCSLLISSFWSTKTMKLTQETQKISMDNQKISFMMDLIKNNYQLLKDKEKDIDSLINDLDSAYLGKSFFFNQVADLFHEKLRANQDKFPLHEIDEYINNQNKNQIRGQHKPNTDLIKDFKNVFQEDKKDASFKILVTYFSQNRGKTSNVFESLTDSTQKKASGNHKHISFLNRTFKMNDFIENFLQERMVKEILGRTVESLEFEEIKPGMEMIFNNHYGNLGHFFRNSYRVVKFINYFSDTHFKFDPDFRKTYLGVLRSYYSENVLLAIYYNSIFTKKGLGYARELALSDFFGDESDLNDDDPIHVRKNKFYFNRSDFRVIKRIFVSNASPFPTGEGDSKDIETIKNFFNHS